MRTRFDLPSKQTLLNLTRKYVTLRFIEFAMATGAGFLLNLSILAVGVIALFHTTAVSPPGDSSPTILGLDVLALGAGDTLAFIINEQVTVRGEGEMKIGKFAWLSRLGKYQLTAFMGNMIIALVQVSLLLTFALAPTKGDMAGAVISYPITYMVSMRFVWKLHGFRDLPKPLAAPGRLLKLALRIRRK